MIKDKRITIRFDSETEEQFERIREAIKEKLGIKMNNSELIRYLINQLEKGIEK